jgi:hypothetical protein
MDLQRVRCEVKLFNGGQSPALNIRITAHAAHPTMIATNVFAKGSVESGIARIECDIVPASEARTTILVWDRKHFGEEMFSTLIETNHPFHFEGEYEWTDVFDDKHGGVFSLSEFMLKSKIPEADVVRSGDLLGINKGINKPKNG